MIIFQEVSMSIFQLVIKKMAEPFLVTSKQKIVKKPTKQSVEFPLVFQIFFFFCVTHNMFYVILFDDLKKWLFLLMTL